MASTQSKYVISGYDGHGSVSGIVFSKAFGVPSSNVIIRFPDCSPEGAPKLLYSLSLYNTEVNILDIPVNLKNPSEWFSIMKVIASNNRVYLYDHHESNTKFLNQLKDINITLYQFSDTVTMARAISADDPELFTFSLIGSITDRDPSVAKILSDTEINEMLRIANRYDVLIRTNLSQVVSQLLSTPKESLMDVLRSMTSGVDYPPERLVSQIQVIRKFYNVHVVKLPSYQVLGAWTWKTLDEYARRNAVDYIVGVGEVLDRQLNQPVNVVFVIRYWLSSSPSPLNIVKPIIGSRRVIGHADGFSVSAISQNDAEQLAMQIAESLTSPSNVVSFLPASSVATAIAQDYKQILLKLAEILEEQRKMYQEYLSLKREQVNLLKNASSEDKRRYD